MNKSKFQDILKKYNLLFLLLIFVVVSSILSPNFLKVSNLFNMLQQCSVSGIIAIGMTLVIILGGIDLSVGAVAAFSGMISALLISKDINIVIAIIAGIVIGAVFGLISGLLISKCKLPDFIVTLAIMEISRGLALLLTKGEPIFGLDNKFHIIGGGKIGGLVPIAGIIWIVMTVIVALMLKYTLFGRSLYAIGGNREAAVLSGIKAKKNYCITYIICAMFAGFAGILTASWLSTGQPTACSGYELDAIAASVIGGASLAGGVGNVIGTFGGVVLLQIITNIFNLVGLSSFYQQIAKGLIIIAALLMNKLVVAKQN